MNASQATTTAGFQGYNTIAACSSDKAADALRSLGGVSPAVFTKLQSIVLQSAQADRPQEVVSASNKLLLFLMKLKLNLSYSTLAVLFSLHRTTCSKHFFLVLTILHEKLRCFIYWPFQSTV
ncbi:hypothetical protein HPB48_010802 [Haemaphysalis longicornis]|uniref:Transposase Helix-turn-helix domain-containing protein n=1 Tax=Haemaphysalis longicornis TaxID=44386 RepID=A0A9J6G9F0_HAELO|nr:hypothetical protein HPB48_010802 [Haemaphysalis longicornis]